jgi:2-methylcitrate dehydratase PrpD
VSAPVSETYADRLAEFSVSLQEDAIPREVIRQAEVAGMDYIGVVLGGGVTPASDITAEYVLEQNGVGEATLFGTQSKAPIAMAAMANGTRCHSIELDDHEAHMRSKVHSGAVIMTAAWAAAEKRGNVTGAEFLAAAVVGYDVIGRTSGATSYPDFLGREKGFHTTPLFGGFAAAATAGRLLGLTAEQLSNAFGIAGSMCSGLQETVRVGAMVKPFHAGWAAHSGITAALLAAKGYTGPRTIFEGSKGFFRSYCGEGNYDLSIIDRDFGVDFDISLNMYKPYACGGGIHPTLTAVDTLRGKHDFEHADIERVVVRTSQHVVDYFATPLEAKIAPASGPQAQHALPFAVATLIVDGAALIGQFTNEAVRRPEVLALSHKVSVEADPSIKSDDPEDEPAGVAIHLKDGTVLEAETRGGKGSLSVPMSEEELIDKYHRLADPVVGADVATATRVRLLSLATDPNVVDIPPSLYRRS